MSVLTSFVVHQETGKKSSLSLFRPSIIAPMENSSRFYCIQVACTVTLVYKFCVTKQTSWTREFVFFFSGKIFSLALKRRSWDFTRSVGQRGLFLTRFDLKEELTLQPFWCAVNQHPSEITAKAFLTTVRNQRRCFDACYFVTLLHKGHRCRTNALGRPMASLQQHRCGTWCVIRRKSKDTESAPLAFLFHCGKFTSLKWCLFKLHIPLEAKLYFKCTLQNC